MAKRIFIWMTDSQYKQFTESSEFLPSEFLTLAMLKRVGVEVTKENGRELLEAQASQTRQEFGRKKDRSALRLRGALKVMGPMTAAELAIHLEMSKSQVRRLLLEDKWVDRVNTKNGAYLWGLKDN